MPDNFETLVGLTAQIVSAHVSHNTVSPDQLPDLIKRVYQSLGGVTRQEPEQDKTPAVPVKQSLRQDTILCLDCGKPFKMLKRHLNTDHKMTPVQYRQKWNLPASYPMVAPSYAKVRSNLAKEIGLGTQHATRRARRRRTR